MLEPNINLTDGPSGEGRPIEIGQQPAAKCVPVVLASNQPAVPVTFDTGVPVYDEAEANTTPGTEQTIISTAVPAGKTRRLAAAIVDCRTEGRFTVEAGGVVIGSGRTSAASPLAIFTFTPARPIAASTALAVKFTARPNSAVNTVRAYLQGSES